jgi:hypothetical protein
MPNIIIIRNNGISTSNLKLTKKYDALKTKSDADNLNAIRTKLRNKKNEYFVKIGNKEFENKNLVFFGYTSGKTVINNKLPFEHGDKLYDDIIISLYDSNNDNCITDFDSNVYQQFIQKNTKNVKPIKNKKPKKGKNLKEINQLAENKLNKKFEAYEELEKEEYLMTSEDEY